MKNRSNNGTRMSHGSKQRNGHRQLLKVGGSRVHGQGVYARRAIRKGRRIIEYTGRIVPWEKAPDQGDGPHTFLFGLTNGRDVIDPSIDGNEARWINHSCDPNCEAIEEGDRVFIYALQTVQPGEELFYDYGLEVDQPRTPELEEEYKCHCGSAACRGTLLAKEKANPASARAAKRRQKARRRKRTARA